MSAAKYKDAILETIDQLRKRKARPDVERICHMVERKHGLSLEDTKTDLGKLVEEGIVVKVEYKGNTSYRNADKLKTSKLVNVQQNANTVKDILYRAIIALTEPGEDGRREKRLGASVKDLQKWILREDASEKIAKTRFRLQLALHRAVDANVILRLANGKYVLSGVNRNGKAKVDEAASPPPNSRSALDDQEASPIPAPSTSTATAAPSNGSTPNGKTTNPTKKGVKGRPPNKRKKFRKKRDSVDRESPDAKRQKQDSSEHRDEKQKDTMTATVVSDTLVANDPRCDFCLLTSSSNKAGVPEDLLFCKDCQAKAHPSCMDYSEELAARAKNSPWQCIDCKTCFICEDSGDPDAMLFCDACDKGYHMNCHKPPIKEKPTGKWVCSGCEAELGLSPADTTDEHLTLPTDNNTDGGGPSCLPTPSDSPVHFLDEHKAEPTKDTLSSTVLKDSLSTLPKLAKTLSASVPDASDWTIDNVVEFFTDVGFTEQAQQFREQEIDGKSLLLMKRSDVLMGLALRLGPALKIYAHVERLQTRGDTLL